MTDHALDPEVALALAYAPQAARTALTALWAFDAKLGAILRTTREPTIGQLRLTWWHDAVAHPEQVRGEPVLTALAAAGFAPAGLQRVVEGWEELSDGDDDRALAGYAEARGGGLFTLAAGALGSNASVTDAGAGWALADLARRHSQPAVAERALRLAGERLAAAPARWPRSARSLGVLAKLARRDLAGVETQGSPRRLLAVARLALTGR